MTQGIYAITHKPSGRRYIGASEHIEVRWYHHNCGLKGKYHHNAELQSVWDSSQEEDFVFEIVEVIKNRRDLRQTEEKYLAIESHPFNAVNIISSSLQNINPISISKSLPNYTTVKEAAEYLHLNEGSIRNLIRRGHLRYTKIDNRTNLVEWESIREYEADPPKRTGRPKRQKEEQPQ
jgi:excisionase family DNA binding protein